MDWLAGSRQSLFELIGTRYGRRFALLAAIGFLANIFNAPSSQLMNKYLSVGGAIENLLLAATDLGLGTCPVTFSFWVRDEIGRMLDVPEDRMIVSLVTLGYPTDQPPVAPAHKTDVAVYLD